MVWLDWLAILEVAVLTFVIACCVLLPRPPARREEDASEG